MRIPTTRYTQTVDGVHIAYQVFGDGPHDLMIHLPWISNVDAVWEMEEWATILDAFGRHARVILFDRRGLGASDRPTSHDVMAIEQGIEDIRAVLGAVGSERPALLGYEAGGTVMLLFAASHPGRVSALGLVAPHVYYWKTTEFPWGNSHEDAAEWRARIEHGWGTPEFWRWNWQDISDRTLTDEEVEAWARFTRLCASPEAALAIDSVEQEIDVRAILPQIQVPTLVMRARGDLDRGFGQDSAWVAGQIPGARYIEVGSGDHIPWHIDEYGEFFGFLSQIHEREAIFDRVLATVLFTDIVDSTHRAAELGDRAWRDLVERHHTVSRAIIGRYRGSEVDTAGDGFFATFDGPARAVTCAREIIEAVRPIGLEVRAGVHTGEVETINDKVGGIAVAIGARVGSTAGPSEVLVSQTVKDLTAGSGLTFEDAGEHELKGVPDRWRLYRVVG